MAEYYRSHFQIVDEDSVGLELLDKVRSVIQSWIHSTYNGYSGESDKPELDSKCHGETGVFCMTWMGNGWRLDLRLATDGNDMEVDVEVQDSDSQRVNYRNYRASPPSIVHDLFDQFDCRSDDRRLTTQARYIAKEEAIGFTRNLVLDTTRRLPLIVITAYQDNQFYPMPPNFIQSKLLGIATVFYYNNHTAKIINEELQHIRCYNGAVRVYAPVSSEEFSENDRYNHAYWAPTDAAKLKDNWFQIRDACMSHIMIGSTRRLYDNVAEEIRNMKYQEDRKRIEEDSKAAQELLYETDMEAQNRSDEADKHILELLDERERLTNTAQEQDEEIRKLRWTVEQLKAQLSYKSDAVVLNIAPPPEFNSLKDVLEYVRGNLSSVEIFGSAMESASESDFRRPDDAWNVFEKMDKCARERVSGSLGKDISTWFKECGIDYSPHESETTKAMYSSERTFEGVFMEEHFKLGRGGDTQNHLRIHVRWQDSPGKWQVGYVGKHLPTRKRIIYLPNTIGI